MCRSFVQISVNPPLLAAIRWIASPALMKTLPGRDRRASCTSQSRIRRLESGSRSPARYGNERPPSALAPAGGLIVFPDSGGEWRRLLREVVHQPRSRLSETNLPLSSRNRGNRFMASQCPAGKPGAGGRAGLISATGTPLFSITIASPEATRSTTKPVGRWSSRTVTRMSHIASHSRLKFTPTRCQERRSRTAMVCSGWLAHETRSPSLRIAVSRYSPRSGLR
jgi:hypothetical protein